MPGKKRYPFPYPQFSLTKLNIITKRKDHFQESLANRGLMSSSGDSNERMEEKSHHSGAIQDNEQGYQKMSRSLLLALKQARRPQLVPEQASSVWVPAG